MICHRRMGCEERGGHRALVSVSDIPSHEQVIAEFNVARLNGQPMPHRRHSFNPCSKYSTELSELDHFRPDCAGRKCKTGKTSGKLCYLERCCAFHQHNDGGFPSLGPLRLHHAASACPGFCPCYPQMV